MWQWKSSPCPAHTKATTVSLVLCVAVRALSFFLRHLLWKWPCYFILMFNYSSFQQKQNYGFVIIYVYTHSYSQASVTRVETIGIIVTLLFETSFTDGSSKAFDHAKLCGSMKSMYRILSSCREIASEKAEWFNCCYSKASILGRPLVFTNFKRVARMEIDPVL